ncbi:MAG: hypothetical protein OHM56_03010 [Spiroplasma phoeniceum]|nr:MAG: hypothetical protein OHM57_02460 [Spiroplasma phoeniceum]UZQ32935.1 MAG: hypothetical protein OHM56_03010 [Spiroplasma phoeniceum]
MFDIEKYILDCEKKDIQVSILLELEDWEFKIYDVILQFRYKNELISDLSMWISNCDLDTSLSEQINDWIETSPEIEVELNSIVENILVSQESTISR